MFFFDPSSLKILVKFSSFSYFAHINTANKWRKYRKIVGNIFEKITLENRKISNFVYSLAARFFLAIFNCKFNQLPSRSATKVDSQFLHGIMQKMAAKMIHTTVKMHGQLITWSSRHTVNSSQCRCTWRSTRHMILGDFRVWQVDRHAVWRVDWLLPWAWCKIMVNALSYLAWFIRAPSPLSLIKPLCQCARHVGLFHRPNWPAYPPIVAQSVELVDPLTVPPTRPTHQPLTRPINYPPATASSSN